MLRLRLKTGKFQITIKLTKAASRNGRALCLCLSWCHTSGSVGDV